MQQKQRYGVFGLNEHITENISYYLSLEKPEYAILLSGKWGSGKTYFIDDFIKEYIKSNSSDDQKKRFIKISLFGLKDVSAIDEQIFQNLHPILASKYAKLTGNLLKSALKLGINFDCDGDGKKDGSLSTSLEKFNPLDFFTDKPKKDKEIIFVFDDLERTEINTKEVLGYINYLVEQASFKVILIANEDKLIEVKEDVYIDFKEKVIGKTFEVRHNFPDVLDKFLDDNPIEIDGFKKSIIKGVYNQARYDNLRHIRQSIIDFIYITKKIDKKYLDNTGFLSKFTYIFFCLNIEAKSGALDESGFSSYNGLLSSLDDTNKEDKPPITELLKKYSLDEVDFLLPKQSWIKILYKSYIEPNVLDSIISKLSFFIEEKEHERPSWVKLWNYRELEDEEFIRLLQDVTEKFNKCEYETPALLLHAVALLINFNKEGLSDYSLVGIQAQLNICLLPENFTKYPSWKEKVLGNNGMSNGTGLSYMNDNDSDFIKMYERVRTVNTDIYNSNKKTEEKKLLDKFIGSIKTGDFGFIEGFLLDHNAFLPMLSSLTADSFFSAILETSNKNLYQLSQIMNSRYSNNIAEFKS